MIIRNSYLHCGTQVPSGNGGCVDANSANVYNLLVANNTIIPDHPSYYRDGIVGHEFTARANHISRSNDGIGIFNRPGGSTKANLLVEGNFIHDLTHWKKIPHTATARTTTASRSRAARTSPSEATPSWDLSSPVMDLASTERMVVRR